MRIHLTLTPNENIIAYDHIPNLVGVLHKWLGANNSLHGATSLYSFSWLQGGQKGNGGLYFPKGASFFISAYDDALIKRVVNGAMDQPQLFAGMQVKEIRIQHTPLFDQEAAYFTVASPVLIKLKEENRVKHCLFSDPEANESLTKSMQKKMGLDGVDTTGMSISFDRNYHQAHTKLVNYNGIKNRVSLCPVIVKGTPEQMAFVWNVGVGNSTGVGFGALN